MGDGDTKPPQPLNTNLAPVATDKSPSSKKVQGKGPNFRLSSDFAIYLSFLCQLILTLKSRNRSIPAQCFWILSAFVCQGVNQGWILNTVSAQTIIWRASPKSALHDSVHLMSEFKCGTGVSGMSSAIASDDKHSYTYLPYLKEGSVLQFANIPHSYYINHSLSWMALLLTITKSNL